MEKKEITNNIIDVAVDCGNLSRARALEYLAEIKSTLVSENPDLRFLVHSDNVKVQVLPLEDRKVFFVDADKMSPQVYKKYIEELAKDIEEAGLTNNLIIQNLSEKSSN